MFGKCNAQRQNMRQSTGCRHGGPCNKPGRVFVCADYNILATFEKAPAPNTVSLSWCRRYPHYRFGDAPRYVPATSRFCKRNIILLAQKSSFNPVWVMWFSLGGNFPQELLFLTDTACFPTGTKINVIRLANHQPFCAPQWPSLDKQTKWIVLLLFSKIHSGCQLQGWGRFPFQFAWCLQDLAKFVHCFRVKGFGVLELMAWGF